MRQIVLIVVLAVVVLAAGGVLLLGAFPPHVNPQPIVHTLPTDRFGGH
jgi:hypothetical protein